MKFELPPRPRNAAGNLRKVGFELEFGGVGLVESAQILVDIFGGSLEKKGEYVCAVKTDLGVFQVEADAVFLKEKRHEKYFEALGLSSDPRESLIARGVDHALSTLAGTLVPFEVVTPPLEIDKLEVVEEIRERLRRQLARGTHSNALLAFGMQFNPEVPDETAPTLLGILRAFFLIFDWLYEASNIPLVRRLSPYINDFPAAYVKMVLNPDYAPDLAQFVTDYLEHNPTRNRPLDLLPLLSHIDHAKVFSYPIEKDLVKSRPTFHYRLPNSEVNDPAWTIARDWNSWVAVERLAHDPARVREMCEDYARVHADLMFTRAKWITRTREWLGE